MKEICKSRRNFLKSSALGAAAVSVGSITAGKAHAKTSEWSDGMQINPAIDNLRVGMIKDRGMVIEDFPGNWVFSTVNANVNVTKVEACLDSLANYISQKTSADEAWAAIFQRPPSKTWGEVRVALKINCIKNTIMPHVSILNKVCKELNKLGVPFANMVVWDGERSSNDGPTLYIPYTGGNGLENGIQVSVDNSLLGNWAPAPVPAPYNRTENCTADIANGKIDILVNVSVNKGHDHTRGSMTASMKNHFGTFAPRPGGHEGGDESQFNFLIGINKSSAVLGGEVPRQQLCIVDSIYAARPGPHSDPDSTTYTLLMGTFGPAIDYATAKVVREQEMGASHSSYLERFLTSFGYTESEQNDFIALSPEENGGKGVGNAADGTVKTGSQTGETVNFHLIAGKYLSRAVKINFPASEKIVSVSIYAATGRIIRKLNASSIGKRGITWDGRDSHGNYASRGTYLVEVKGRNRSGSGKILLSS